MVERMGRVERKPKTNTAVMPPNRAEKNKKDILVEPICFGILSGVAAVAVATIIYKLKSN